MIPKQQLCNAARLIQNVVGICNMAIIAECRRHVYAAGLQVPLYAQVENLQRLQNLQKLLKGRPW